MKRKKLLTVSIAFSFIFLLIILAYFGKVKKNYISFKFVYKDVVINLNGAHLSFTSFFRKDIDNFYQFCDHSVRYRYQSPNECSIFKYDKNKRNILEGSSVIDLLIDNKLSESKTFQGKEYVAFFMNSKKLKSIKSSCPIYLSLLKAKFPTKSHYFVSSFEINSVRYEKNLMNIYIDSNHNKKNYICMRSVAIPKSSFVHLFF